jgi:hypothetical protein
MSSPPPEGAASELERLRSLLLTMGFDDSIMSKFVSLGADQDMRFCAVKDDNGIWDVYYTERGNRSIEVRVSTLRGAAYAMVAMIGRGDLVTAVRRSVAEHHLG